jgi:transposase
VAKKRSQENTKKKQDYVASLVKQNPKITLNEVGKKVTEKFGTQLAYDKRREAFVGAGGKIDTRRGPAKGSKRKKGKSKTGKAKSAKKSAKKGPKKYGKRSPEATRKKQDFVKELVKANPDITMNEAHDRVKKKFGTQLAHDKMREAFKGAGGKIRKPGRRKGSRNKTTRKSRRVGRRASDRRAARTAATLKGMPEHVVIVRTDGGVETNEFNTKNQAVAFAKSQVHAGVPVSDISYYLRQALEISVGI